MTARGLDLTTHAMWKSFAKCRRDSFVEYERQGCHIVITFTQHYDDGAWDWPWLFQGTYSATAITVSNYHLLWTSCSVWHFSSSLHSYGKTLLVSKSQEKLLLLCDKYYFRWLQWCFAACNKKKSKKCDKRFSHRLGIEPRSPALQAGILTTRRAPRKSQETQKTQAILTRSSFWEEFGGQF